VRAELGGRTAGHLFATREDSKGEKMKGKPFWIILQDKVTVLSSEN
jgi:hypothetical protein